MNERKLGMKGEKEGGRKGEKGKNKTVALLAVPKWRESWRAGEERSPSMETQKIGILEV